MKPYVEAGFTTFDMADHYGSAEEIVGIFHKKFARDTPVQLFGFGFSRGKGEKNSNQYEKDQIISYASGTCLFTSSKIMKSLSGFDPFLFAYHDDLDLCWRASLQGINSYYVHN